MKKQTLPKSFENSKKDNDKGVKEDSKADKALDFKQYYGPGGGGKPPKTSPAKKKGGK